MFERVLFPTDFSEHAKRALDCVAGLPEIGEVILLHVADTEKTGRERWVEDAIEKTVTRSLEEEKNFLEKSGVAVKTMIKQPKSGSVGPTIVETSIKEHASVIVMSARGKSLVRGLLLGSVPSYVLRNAKKPLLIMRYKMIETLSGKVYQKFCPMVLSNVLCPTDFSGFSDQTIERTSSIPGIGSILLVHVVSRGESKSEILARQEQADEKLGKIKDVLEKKGIPTTFKVGIGNPSAEINRIAEEEDVSLICMSCFGRGWFDKLMVGSTCAEVAKNTARPILILK